jgi:heme exporter protein A
VEWIVQFDGAGVSLGGHPVLADLDLSLGSGESLGVVGPNGSGKTTLARTVATLIKADSGSTTILGVDTASHDAAPVRGSIGLMGHQPALIPELTLEENLIHVARLAGVDPARVAHALDVVGLADAANRHARACSFGMQRRVEIAHLLLTRPRLLLLDEAAAGLDESARDLVGALVESVRGRGGGAIVVSHDRAQLESLCDRVLRLQSGRLEDPS